MHARIDFQKHHAIVRVGPGALVDAARAVRVLDALIDAAVLGQDVPTALWCRSNSDAIVRNDSRGCQRSHISAVWLSV